MYYYNSKDKERSNNPNTPFKSTASSLSNNNKKILSNVIPSSNMSTNQYSKGENFESRIGITNKIAALNTFGSSSSTIENNLSLNNANFINNKNLFVVTGNSFGGGITGGHKSTNIGNPSASTKQSLIRKDMTGGMNTTTNTLGAYKPNFSGYQTSSANFYSGGGGLNSGSMNNPSTSNKIVTRKY